MKKVIYLSSILVSSLISSNAYAEITDAASAGLGGTTMGQSNNAFAPMRNPASMVDVGWGSFVLPLSSVINFGSTSKPLSSFTGLIGNSNLGSASLDLVSGFFKTDASRVEVQGFLPILGFTGAPSKNFAIMGRPISFGVNLWGRAVTTANFSSSKGLGALISNSPGLFNSVNELQNQSSTINSQFSGINSLNIPDANQFKNVNPNNKEDVERVITEVQTFQNNTLKPIITDSDSAVNSISQTTNNLKSILTSLEDISKNAQTGKGEVVADGHAVIAVSGATNIFKNSLVDLSVGVNLKGFFFPANASLGNSGNSNPLLNTLIGQNGTNKLIPITVKADIQTGVFKSVSDIKNIVDTRLSPLVQDARDLVNTAKSLDNQLDTAVITARDNALNVDAGTIQTTVSTLQNQSREVSNTVNNNFSQNLINEVQTALANDLKDVKINLNQMTDISPLGFGIDIGAQAKIMDNLVLGLVFENPLVLWPAKMKNNQMAFDSNKLQQTFGKSNIDIGSLFSIVEDKNPQSTNYNLSEPFAIRFGGSYSLDKLSSFLNNSSVVADVEQVFNGRPFAAHIGLEKGWAFKDNNLYLRLGTQLGGIGNMFTAGLGFRASVFNISVGYGASNPFNPLGSNNALAALSTSLSF